jgi:hypothetical protein
MSPTSVLVACGTNRDGKNSCSSRDRRDHSTSKMVPRGSGSRRTVGAFISDGWDLGSTPNGSSDAGHGLAGADGDGDGAGVWLPLPPLQPESKTASVSAVNVAVMIRGTANPV